MSDLLFGEILCSSVGLSALYLYHRIGDINRDISVGCLSVGLLLLVAGIVCGICNLIECVKNNKSEVKCEDN